MKNAIVRTIKTWPVTAYFTITYAFSWSIWWLSGLLLSPSAPWGIRITIHSIALFGPTVSAVVVSGVLNGKKGIVELLKRITIWRVGLPWYAFALGSTLVIALSAVAAHSLISGASPRFTFAFVLIRVITSGLPEEYGWRGFALPHMLKKYNAVSASLIIGVMWALWHIPVAPGLLDIRIFPYFMLDVLAISILFSWLYINTRGSILMAILYHLAINVVAFMTDVPGTFTLWPIYIGLNWLIVLIIILRCGSGLATKKS